MLDEGIELSKKEEYDGTTGKWLKLKLKILRGRIALLKSLIRVAYCLYPVESSWNIIIN